MHACTNKKKPQQQEHRIRGTGVLNPPFVEVTQRKKVLVKHSQVSGQTVTVEAGLCLQTVLNCRCVCPIPCVNTRHQAAHTIRPRATAMSLTQHGDQELLHNPDTSESGQGKHGWLLRKTVGTSLWYGKKGHPHPALKSSERGQRVSLDMRPWG